MENKENKERKVQHFQILNKNKEHLIIVAGKEKMKVTWEEFKESYVMEKDRLHCHLNEKAQKEYNELADKLDDLFAKAIAHAMTVNAPITALSPKMKLASMYGLGSVVTEIQELSGLPLSKIIETIKLGVLRVKTEFGQPEKKKPEAVEVEVEEKPNSRAGTFKDLPGMDKLMDKFNIKDNE